MPRRVAILQPFLARSGAVQPQWAYRIFAALGLYWLLRTRHIAEDLPNDSERRKSLLPGFYVTGVMVVGIGWLAFALVELYRHYWR